VPFLLEKMEAIWNEQVKKEKMDMPHRLSSGILGWSGGVKHSFFATPKF